MHAVMKVDADEVMYFLLHCSNGECMLEGMDGGMGPSWSGGGKSEWWLEIITVQAG